jgi:hypothetical protein
MYNSKIASPRRYDFHSPHSTVYNPPKRKVHDFMFASRPAFPGTNISIKTTDSFDSNSFSSSSTYRLYQNNAHGRMPQVCSSSLENTDKMSATSAPPEQALHIQKKPQNRLRTATCPSPLHAVPPLLIHRKQSSIGHVPIRKHTRSKNRATTIL